MWSVKHSRSFIHSPELEAISSWNKQGVGLLTGYSGIFFLSHIWQFYLVRSGYVIHNIDCAIRFDAYAIAEEALGNQIAPEDIHDKITVSRCFTPYQILDETRDVIQTANPDRLCFILAPSKQFFDGDVSFDEGSFLLKKLTGLFLDFQKKSIPLMIVEKENYSHHAFRLFYAEIVKMANPVFRLKIMQQQFKKYYSVRISSTQANEKKGEKLWDAQSLLIP
ncbi:MAG: hypothetical protein OEV66_01705 [Spirochaetia bacterium]|nr:hypothetical protein [Spirochaetia bacterium]